MTEHVPPPAPIGGAALEPSAGAMLRAAREKRGLHIAALAASIKVTPRKLEALEADRHGELPDLTFTRALAQTVCRALKIDAEPVLAKLPQAAGLPRLSQVGGGLNAPFRESAGKTGPGQMAFLRKPIFWATVVVLACALALGLLPSRWIPWRIGASPAASAAAAGPSPVPLSTPAPALATAPVVAPIAAGVASVPSAATPASVVGETVHSAPSQDAAGAAPVSTNAVLAVRTSSESWVEVQDARGQPLLSRTVQPGETIGLDGALPLRLTIGNAAATQLVFRGRPVDLAASTRENVARLQLP